MLVGAEWIAVPLDKKLCRVETVSAVESGRVSRTSSFSGGGGARAVEDMAGGDRCGRVEQSKSSS